MIKLLASNNPMPIDSLDLVLMILLGVFGIILLAALIFATITRIRIFATYRKLNKIMNSEGLTGKEATRKFLDMVELESVGVEKCSWWRALFSLGGAMGFGNNYSIYKKTIFLRRNIVDKKSLTAVGIGTQKVGLAMLDKRGDKQYRFTARIKPFLFFAPVAFLPLIIIGTILDVLIFKSVGIMTVVFTLIGLAYYILAFLILLFTIKTEKRANKISIGLMEETNFLTPEERENIKTLYNTYILAYIADFIVALLKLITSILKFILKASSKLNKNRR